MRDIILNNFWWKVTALCLAVLAWFGFQPRELRTYLLPRTEEHTRVMIAHPVTIAKPATDTREFKVAPLEVEITIKGDEKALRNLPSGEVRATVEISEFKENLGTNMMKIHVYVPPEGVELVRLVPERVQVEVLKE